MMVMMVMLGRFTSKFSFCDSVVTLQNWHATETSAITMFFFPQHVILFAWAMNFQSPNDQTQSGIPFLSIFG